MMKKAVFMRVSAVAGGVRRSGERPSAYHYDLLQCNIFVNIIYILTKVYAEYEQITIAELANTYF